MQERCPLSFFLARSFERYTFQYPSSAIFLVFFLFFPLFSLRGKGRAAAVARADADPAGYILGEDDWPGVCRFFFPSKSIDTVRFLAGPGPALSAITMMKYETIPPFSRARHAGVDPRAAKRTAASARALSSGPAGPLPPFFFSFPFPLRKSYNVSRRPRFFLFLLLFCKLDGGMMLGPGTRPSLARFAAAFSSGAEFSGRIPRFSSKKAPRGRHRSSFSLPFSRFAIQPRQ